MEEEAQKAKEEKEREEQEKENAQHLIDQMPEEEQITEKKVTNDVEKTLKDTQQTIDLAEIEEGKCTEPDTGETRRLLPGFIQANIRIHLLTDDLTTLYKKSKYDSLFDIGVLSLQSANYIDGKLPKLFKNGAKVHIESADNLVIMKKDQKKEYRDKIGEKCKEAGFKAASTCPSSHHALYEVDKDVLKATEDLD